MANKKIGGYGLSVSNKANEQMKSSPIQNAEQKTKDLINSNPTGTSIAKFSNSINDQLTQYLPMKKMELAELEKIKAQGSQAEVYRRQATKNHKNHYNTATIFLRYYLIQLTDIHKDAKHYKTTHNL